ncbi:MAG: hypothetical protein NT062_02655, partial [Proteobacteria bacterium]|nr:hypothetical protein [Pseudomonadota bacterium]
MKFRPTLLLLLLVPLTLSCGDTTETSASQLNLDRPVDMSFACWGGLRITGGGPGTVDQEIQVTGQPLASCDTRSLPHATGEPQPVPVGQETIDISSVPGVAYYGFILQQTRGTVAIARWEPKPSSSVASGEGVTVLDADPLTPGKNGISIGEDPIAIITDKSGCKEVTANAGSCDLSVLDVSSALDADPAVDVQRLDVTANGVPLRARPAAMVVEPMTTVVGNACAATATGLAYIAYPSCHLVAAVDLTDGKVVGGI